jgi:hypothetical protein
VDFVDTAADEFGKGEIYRYRLPAALPVGRLRVALGSDNTTTEVIVDGLTGEAQGASTWVPIGRILLFRLRQGELRVDNDDYVLAAPLTAKEWRLRSPVRLNPTPSVEVAYLPDRFVFLAQGRGPYTLAAGSRTARRDALPVEQALAPLRRQLGAEWTPPLATLGARADAAGAKAYEDAPAPIDWRRWMLWGFLVLGAAVVGGFALTLLRTKSSPTQG